MGVSIIVVLLKSIHTICHAGTTGSPVTTEQLGLELHPRAEGKEEAEEGTGVRDRGLVTNS